MKKKILLLVKRIKQFANVDIETSANFLLYTFTKYDIFSLSENKQKIIIDNLLVYFDTIICGIDSYKKRNKYFSENDILNHIYEKVLDLKAISEHLKLY